MLNFMLVKTEVKLLFACPGRLLYFLIDNWVPLAVLRMIQSKMFLPSCQLAPNMLSYKTTRNFSLTCDIIA